jgi:NADH:ubiquinone oxidoreductase subunit K
MTDHIVAWLFVLAVAAAVVAVVVVALMDAWRGRRR